MTIAVTGRSSVVSAGAVTANSVTLPATINAGDVIYIMALCSGASNGNMFPVPLGLRDYVLAFVQSGGGTTEVTIYYYYKVANGDEGGTNVSWTSESNERVIQAGVIAECDLRYGPVFAGVGSTSVPPAPSPPNPPNLTPPWGLATYLWQVGAAHDDANNVFAGGPAGYDFTEFLDEPGADVVGVGTAYADKVSTAASEDPATYTLSAVEENCAITAAWLGLSGSQSRPVAWHATESVSGTTNDITIVIPADENPRLVVGVCKSAAPTSVVLDPAGLNLSLSILTDGVTSASHADGGSDFTTLWQLPAINTPVAGSYTLRISFAAALRRTVNVMVLRDIDAGDVESVTIRINDTQMASSVVNTVAPSCTLLAYASRVCNVNTTTQPFDQHDLDGFPMVSYGYYYPNNIGERGAGPMVRGGLAPGSHTLQLDAQATDAVVVIIVALKEASGDDPIRFSTDF